MLVRSGGHCGAVWWMACAVSDAAADVPLVPYLPRCEIKRRMLVLEFMFRLPRAQEEAASGFLALNTLFGQEENPFKDKRQPCPHVHVPSAGGVTRGQAQHVDKNLRGSVCGSAGPIM